MMQHPFWNQTYCRLHIFDGTPQCSICERYEKKEEQQHMKLGDGRNICRECHWTAIMDVDALKSLKNYLLHFFKTNKLKFKINIPMYLVDIDDITNLATLRPTVNYKDFKPSIKEGICKAMGYKTLGDQKTDPIGNAQKKYGIKNTLERIYVKTDKERINATIIDEDDLDLDEIDH
ncbi:hypothetical protein ACOSQ2_005747 [Xanthoceras sorbifolium]